MNLDLTPRNDFVTLDSQLTPAGEKMINLMAPEIIIPVLATGQRSAVRIGLCPQEMAVFKLLTDP